MPPLVLARESIYICFDGAVVEVFVKAASKSLRVPALWLGVEVNTERHDQVMLNVGTIAADSPVLYGPDVDVTGVYTPLEIPLSDEPAFRQFFAEVAAAVGRTVAG